MVKITVGIGILLTFGSVRTVMGEVKTVRAQGCAAGVDPAAEHLAEWDAKVNAVEKVCPRTLAVDTTAVDFETVRDKIRSRVEGRIQSAEVIRRWQESGLSCCEIRAKVEGCSPDGGGTSVDSSCRYFLMVVQPGTQPGEDPSFGGPFQTRLEEKWTSKGMKLFDRPTIGEILSRDEKAAALDGRADIIVAQAKAMHADRAIWARANVTPLGPMNHNGMNIHRWKLSASLRVISVDTGAVIGSKHVELRDVEKTLGPVCEDSAFVKLADRVAAEVTWPPCDDVNFKSVFLVLRSCPHDLVNQKIRPGLRSLKGVRPGSGGVMLREFAEDTATLEVEWSYDVDALAAALEQLQDEDFRIRVMERSGARIVGEVLTE